MIVKHSKSCGVKKLFICGVDLGADLVHPGDIRVQARAKDILVQVPAEDTPTLDHTADLRVVITEGIVMVRCN